MKNMQDVCARRVWEEEERAIGTCVRDDECACEGNETIARGTDGYARAVPRYRVKLTENSAVALASSR